MIPKVEFVYSYPYDMSLFSLARKKWNRRYVKLTERRIKKFEKAWRKVERKVFSEMVKATGFRWREKKITCFIVNIGSCFSYPLTVRIVGRKKRMMSNEELIDILVHELIHVFIISNGIHKTEKPWYGFGQEARGTKTHIYVHALHEHLYLKLFGKKRLKKDIEKAKFLDKVIQPGYSRAWEIVEQYGHENLLKRLRGAKK
jgi:hypothetical protein